MKIIIITLSASLIFTQLAFCKAHEKRSQAFARVDSIIFSESFDTDTNHDGKPDGWLTMGSVALDTNISCAGSSLKLIGSEPQKARAIRQGIRIEPNKSYLISWWSRTQSVKTYIAVNLRIGERVVDFETEFQGASWDWKHHQGIFHTFAKDTSGAILIQLGSIGTAWVDELEIKRFELSDSSQVITDAAQILYREGDSVAVWVNYPVTKIFWHDLLSPSLPTTEAIHISMAKNEYEPFQLVIHPAEEMPSVKVSITDLLGPGTISADLITVNIVDYANINKKWILDDQARSGYHPDALPWADETVAPADFHTPFWITIRAPSDIPSGLYRGKVMLSGSMAMEFPLEVRVWDFALPVEPRIKITASDGILHSGNVNRYDKRPSETRFSDFAQNLTSHRVTGTRYVAQKLEDQSWARIVGDSVSTDFAIMDQVVAEYFNAGYLTFILPPVSLAASSRPLGQRSWLGLTPLTEEFNRLFKEYCAKIGAHLKQKEWMDRAFFMLWDEPSPQEYQNLHQLYSLVRQADPQLKLALTEEPIPELYDVVDIWEPNLRRNSISELMDRIRERQTAGNEVGGYCNSRYSMLYPLSYQRLWAWTLKKYGLTRTGWYSILQEGLSTSVWVDPVITTPTDSTSSALFPGRSFFLYFDQEGNGRFVNSIRWEALRDGMEDYEYLVELEERMENMAPGSGKALVQQLVDSLVWDNMGTSFEPRMVKLHNLRNETGSKIESLPEPTAVRQNETVKAMPFELFQNYPNPFNSVTKIRYEVAKETKVNLRVFNVLGREVSTLVDGVQPSGTYGVEFDASGLPSGVYFYRMQAHPLNGRQAGNFVDTKKLLLLR